MLVSWYFTTYSSLTNLVMDYNFSVHGEWLILEVGKVEMTLYVGVICSHSREVEVLVYLLHFQCATG